MKLIVAVIVTGVGLGALLIIACGSDKDLESSSGLESPPPVPAASSDTVGSVAKALGVQSSASDESASASGDADRIIDVNNQDPNGSGSYKFSPGEIVLSAGETVQFNITAETEFHTFTVDDLEIDVSVDAGQTEKLVFTFEKSGTYKLYCIPHEAQGMVGTITVQ